MGAAYSIDFRKKVIGYVNRGNSCHNASIKFDIASNTVRNWYKRYKLEGKYLPRKVGGKKSKLRIEEVVNYINNNANLILSEMGKHFGMSDVGALYWLKKLGYSYKKKPLAMWKRVKKKEKST